MYFGGTDQLEVSVPDGVHGEATIDTFTITEESAKFYNMRCLFGGIDSARRQVRPGTYKRLIVSEELMMTNTPAEVRDHVHFIKVAKMNGGDVLINGLGLGMVLEAILKFDNVTSVTVIEISADVIALTKPTFENDERVTIIHADALKWKAPKGKRFSVVWHDIWPTISWKNLPTMATLHRKYGGRCDWQSSWCRAEVHAMR